MGGEHPLDHLVTKPRRLRLIALGALRNWINLCRFRHPAKWTFPLAASSAAADLGTVNTSGPIGWHRSIEDGRTTFMCVLLEKTQRQHAEQWTITETL